ncbi:MAG TPA: 2-oxoglutarate dehydrogenase E1 component [Gemmatimonadales bacterium]
MSSLPISSVFNDGYVAEQYELYRRDPASVDESWRQFFRFAESIGGGGAAGGAAGAASPELLRKVAGAASLVQAIRQYGHLAVTIDPLGSSPPGAAELTPEFHGITEADLAEVPGVALGFPERATGVEVIARLREVYSSRLGFEVWHLSDETEREWFRQQFRSGELLRPLDGDEKTAILRRLSEVDGLERFLGRAYVGAKRFSIEGTDTLVPLLDEAIAQAGKAGAREVVMAMAHRGRLNVLAHVLGKPYGTIFNEFDGKHAAGNAESGTGDVKYHLGFRSVRNVGDGCDVALELVPNPSHLEIANAVLQGVARAHQRVAGAAPGTRNTVDVMPLVMHGDAAFPGEGIVPETLNLSALRAYTVGGTLHVIVNNQVGFTTDPIDARSTHYASDLAKGFEIPVIHVNADDAEAVVMAVRLGVAYRMRFGKDFLIDLVGYRRWGHNEGDEPTFTQPELYERIRAHPTPREVWAQRLVADGVLTQDDVARLEKEAFDRLEQAHADVRAGKPVMSHDPATPESAPTTPPSEETGVPVEELVQINEALLAWPGDFNPHQRLAKQLERRREALHADGGIEWGHAEALAFATLLREGTSVRITGQDAERGTFSHRHAVLHDVKTGDTFTPLARLPRSQAAFEVYNSALSETAVLAFEYGYSVAAPDTLTMWEAQFGDFANMAQVVIDQFITADRAKWGQDSGVVLLLPHGYEGQGPEHSSARLERFLQLSAEGNQRVVYPTTAAQIFHLLRRHVRQRPHRPLVVMTPKSLLRLPAAGSSLSDLTSGRFQAVIDDAAMADRRDQVTRVVFCSGKVYYDIVKERGDAPVAVVRVEELYPWPHEELARVLDGYPNVAEVLWVQEEPQNMGAWSYAAPRLTAVTGTELAPRYVGRPERASPAEGYLGAHQTEQARIVSEALAGVKQLEGGQGQVKV